ncbi:PqqD family protein [Sulfidibacter corallicola]|uniref:PqqD family protein n=1 Tax=Sulfidibacter corallicola TaxID=2818388 RepID=A0A8A4TSA4_SULCO|nr:PqqD family protein [Sulfidibacter corallicola]QTD52846.1 PqqD family protein [Sulfidibacter corallicola]
MLRVQISTSVLTQSVGKESVLLDLKKGTYFELNAMGSAIWNSLQETQSLDQTLERLLSEYQVDRQTLQTDLTDLVGRLKEHGLVELHNQ